MARPSTPSPTTMLVLVLFAAACLTGCRGPRGDLTFRSQHDPVTFEPEAPTAVFIPTDRNSADIYLTDIPRAAFADPDFDITSVTGSVVHIHLFLVPKAGKTPIDPTACVASVRLAVLTGGPAGVYGGGGFIIPSGRPVRSTLSGDIQNATLRLIAADERFQDKLRANELTGGFRAVRDDALAMAIGDHLAELYRDTPERQPVASRASSPR